jgi:tartrate-resistant acid phosphatase type 5
MGRPNEAPTLSPRRDGGNAARRHALEELILLRHAGVMGEAYGKDLHRGSTMLLCLRLALCLAMVVLAACGPSAPATTMATEGPPAAEEPVLLPEAARLRFIVVGDAGTQDETQASVARNIKAVCDLRGCDFALGLGDNIYYAGPVVGPDDPQFMTGFEIPYADLDFPFFMALGNHDQGGLGEALIVGDYEVAYHYKPDRASDKWHMPARYYRQKFGAELLEIFAVDGDSLTDDGSGAAPVPAPHIGTPGTIYDPAVQREWLAASVRASRARWKLAFGHYHYGSNGSKAEGTPSIQAALQEAVCDEVQFYVHGHQHDLRWQKPPAGCGRTEIINSGAGGTTGYLSVAESARASDLGYPEYFAYHGTPGFLWVEIAGDRFTGIFYGVDPGVPLFERSVTLAELGWR